jgi:hypothetical protein
MAMTDRMALLEDLADAARAWWNAKTPDACQKHYTALGAAITALDAHPAEPVGETVEVRGCVGVDENGEVYGYCSSRDDDDELRGQVESCGYQPTAMFSIRVPKSPPPIPTIRADVEWERNHVDVEPGV